MLPILSYVQHYKKYHAARFEAASVQYGLNQLEIDILLFLHNNPDCRTASDICRYRGLAKSNVSAAVERLRARGERKSACKRLFHGEIQHLCSTDR